MSLQVFVLLLATAFAAVPSPAQESAGPSAIYKNQNQANESDHSKNWTYFQGSYYKNIKIAGSRINFKEAENICARYYAELAKIRSAEELKFMAELGLDPTATSFTDLPLLGMSRPTSTAPFPQGYYYNWCSYTSLPNNYDEIENCIVLVYKKSYTHQFSIPELENNPQAEACYDDVNCMGNYTGTWGAFRPVGFRSIMCRATATV